MATNSTNDELRKLFQSEFCLNSWMNILQNLFNASQLRKTPEQFSTSEIASCGYYLGCIDTPDGYHIGLFHYEIQKGSVLKKRIGLRNLVRSFINDKWGAYDAALVTYNSGDSWRFSFISDIKGTATHPKRYTYVFGKHQLRYKTPIERFTLLTKEGVTYASLLKAFSVEALSDEFFNEYRKHYADFVEYITGTRYEKEGSKWVEKKKGDPHEMFSRAFKNDAKRVRDYIKKMMGRITFLHFLQRKGWLTDDLNYMQNLFRDSERQDNYLDSVLEPLFFGVLNTKEENREQMFSKKKWDMHLLAKWKSLPYLNGGLFEEDIEDTADCCFPRAYFERLFEFFSKYNFTIDENSPNDAEVGVDPEMLGKIFENLLEDNKDKGAFYTPKEIVQFMCRESLVAYLKRACNGIFPEADIRAFVTEPDDVIALFSKRQRQKLKKALSDIKICDPAIGSGAFPMGLLNELLMCREALETTSINRAELKREIICNNIYGVDIEKGAVDIARLRFWLSIVVDESTPSPLPNLDYKIMQGNSLLESFMGQDLSELSYETKKNDAELLVELWDDTTTTLRKSVSLLLHEYYSCSSHSKKIDLQHRIESLICKQLETKCVNIDILKQLRLLDLAANNTFFLWHTWFSEVFNGSIDTRGFDIVIGNPPYISTKGISSQEKKKYEREWGFSDDAYNLFFFRGMSLLNSTGYLSFITSKTFWTTQTKRNLRDLLLAKQIDYIYDTGNPFNDALVDTCITAVSNVECEPHHEIRFYDGKKSFSNPNVYSIHQAIYRNSQNCVIFTPTEQNMQLQRIFGVKVKQLHDQWWDKIKTSRDIEKNRKELEAYRASLKPGDIALLGCLTDGGQGLATANNGKYLAVKNSSKLALKIRKTRPEKLASAITQNQINLPSVEYSSKKKELEENCEAFLSTLTEQEISELFDNLKESYGRDIFGQGYVYKIVEDRQIADVDLLTQDEKLNGIKSHKPFYVPYDKGDKDGSRWYLETPFVIAWSEENVRFLKTNSGKKGEGMPVYRNPQFYFKEGFCWINVLNPNARLLKVRLKGASVYDVGAMSLIPSICGVEYFVAYLNSNIIFDYYRHFINCSVNIQINDLRQVPVIIPSEQELEQINKLVIEIVLNKNTLEKNERILDSIVLEICKNCK